MVTEAEVIRQFLDLQYGQDKGTAWISVGSGADAVRTFSDNPFQWPEQAEEVVSFIVAQNEAGYNVWYAAHLSYSKAPKPTGQGRAMSMSVKRRRLHVDIDRVLTDQDAAKIRDLDAWVVYSGSPGHVHAYIELNHSVDVATYHRLEDLLVAYFDSDRAVCRDNGLLRIPGTVNRMSAKKSHAPAMVTWDGVVSKTRWNPKDLFEALPAELQAEVKPAVDHGADTIEMQALNIPKSVMDVLMNPTEDRSTKTAQIVNACKASGLSLGETLFCLMADKDQVARYTEKGAGFMYKEIRKLYGTADEYNPQIADRKADDILRTQDYLQPPVETPQHIETPRVLSDAERDQLDNEILMGMEFAERVIEQAAPILSPQEQLEAAQKERGETWAAMDFDSILDGSYVPVMPTMFNLSDQKTSLIYPGLTHSFYGEPGSGKSLIAQLECINQIKAGKDVLYVDFEDGMDGVISRMVEFGGNNPEFKALLKKHLTYVRPREAFDRDLAQWRDILSRQFALCILDGVTESMAFTNHEMNDNSDIAKWFALLPDDIRHNTGAAVIIIDHVTKSRDGRGRMAIGGQHKLAAISGATFTVESDPHSSIGRGKRGSIILRMAKDRPGYLAQDIGPKRASDGTQEACRVTVDSTNTAFGMDPTYSFDPHVPEQSEEEKDFGLKRGIVDQVRNRPGIKKGDMADNLRAARHKFTNVLFDRTLKGLIEDGYVSVTVGASNAHQHSVGERNFDDDHRTPGDSTGTGN